MLKNWEGWYHTKSAILEAGLAVDAGVALNTTLLLDVAYPFPAPVVAPSGSLSWIRA